MNWLLQEFTGRVAGVTHAVLVSRDGLKMAVSGLDTAGADRAAAWMSSLHSLARSASTLIGAPDGGFRQVVIEDAGFLVFVVSADFAAAAGPSLKSGAESGLVGCVLGVLAEPDADVGRVGYEIALLVKSVAEHMTTPTRGGHRTDGNR
ncbi:roadblock/LC7 domain-containing protein [Actinomadura geliboluensis]|uniref:Roadblock/LC7 domain-containing protein n=1 Tax=Actinomadura geliboluensis TaxID=882440 RepID=A0A5S4GD18_9ACTN|nr:roadblock/LC7 domain-containing protein [Actinomadura geliboluensis]TMR30886.1 roadblock/LC7 domain-containing protein [Actinomadura geliboluensis]